jgi:methylated-DNA-[protein]-cysteine S-methyltransferase
MYILLEKTVKQLAEYFTGKRKDFDVPLHLNGTVFQMQAWNELRKILFGETRTCQQIAKAAGNPIGANGSLTGYAGGLETKKFLLDLEKIIIN